MKQQSQKGYEADPSLKVSTTNTDGLLRVFFNLASRLQEELDLQFKNYNRLIREARNKIDIQVKATKKEKMRHFQFFAREEILYWEHFPRKKKFYHEGLAGMRDLIVQETWRENETRDLDHIIHAVMDLLPTCSAKYCQIFGIDNEYLKRPQAGATLTFDRVTENLHMFDSNDKRNWQILGQIITMVVSDAIGVLMDPQNKGAPLFVGPDAASIILSQAKLYSKKLPRQPEDEENGIESNIVQTLYQYVQATWESQIFHYLSKSSRSNFDACLKFIITAMNVDLQKCSEAQATEFLHQIYFGRYLAITPTDMEIGAKVLQLLDTFMSKLNMKVGSEFKKGLLSTLRHFMELLWFGSEESASINQLQFDSEAMKILWSSVSKLFTVTEKLAEKKEKLREQAYLLMAQILKISTDDFLSQNLSKFLATVKFQKYFTPGKEVSAETTLFQLKIVNQLLVCGHTFTHSFKAWRPRTQILTILYNEESSKIFTPVEHRYASLAHVKLQRRVQPGQEKHPIDIFKIYEQIFTPKLGLSVCFQHWQLSEQLIYDNFFQMVTVCIPYLLSFRQSEGQDFLILGLQLCKYLLDPAFGFKKRYAELWPGDTSVIDVLFQVKDLVGSTLKEVIPCLKNPFLQQCLTDYRFQTLPKDQQLSAWTTVASVRTSATLYQKYKKFGQFYLQNKARSVLFDDMNEMQRMDFTYDSDVMNKVCSSLQKNCEVDRAKDSYLRYRIQCQFADNSQYPELTAKNSEGLQLISHVLELLPHIDLNSFCVAFQPLYTVSLKADFNLRANNTMGYPVQALSSEIKFLEEMERVWPTYLLLNLDARIQLKAQKCILKMIVTSAVHIKLSLVDQLCYLIKETMLQGDARILKSLLFTLMNTVKVWLWCERTRFSISGDKSQIISDEVISSDPSDIKFIYTYLHVFKMVDVIALMALCNKDIDLRQAGALTMVNIAKLKRILVKKDLYTPLFDDVIYSHRTSNMRVLSQKMAILNSVRGLPKLTEDQLDSIDFYQLMIDNFEYSKAGLQEFQVRDLQVMYLGELMRLYKQELLKPLDNRTEGVRDLSGAPILNLLQTLSQRTLAQFESRLSEGIELEKDQVGFNLLSAIVISNITKSHQRVLMSIMSQDASQSEEDEIVSSAESISTNTILEETKHLVSMLESNLNAVHKMPFGKFSPARVWTSNILLSFTYYLQDEVKHQSKSIDNLYEVFIIKRIGFDGKHDFAVNCVLFYTMLSFEHLMFNYVEDNQHHLFQLVNVLEILAQVEIPEDQLLRKQMSLKVNLTYNICLLLKHLMQNMQLISTQILPQVMQEQIMSSTRALAPGWEKSEETKWLIPLAKTIQHLIIGFQSQLPSTADIMELDLKFLIQLEQEGYAESLTFYKASKITQKRRGNVQDQQRVNEIKTLIQNVYTFTQYRQLDSTSNLFQKPNQLMQRNVYFRCLMSLLDVSSMRKALEAGQLQEAQNLLAQAMIGCKIDKFVKHGLVQKVFLVCLFITVNSADKAFVEKARMVCLTTLPLMFTVDLTFRAQVESMIVQAPPSILIHFEEKKFYQFIKRVFKAEERYNMEKHFERYYSISGFVRDLLNEIIKLQTNIESRQAQPKMFLRLLDMFTYFFGEVDLRRSPNSQEDQFIFANLIDFKSFEFLSKLYKISEKLVDYDNENMTVMSMWYRLCEGKEANFEVLGKFLVHNLSAFVLKMQASSDKSMISEQELEKHKRYSLAIFNYIKSRGQKMDVRSSIEISTVTWSQKILVIVLRARLNLASKYVFEKLKLKKIIESLHSEMNYQDVKMKLKGGLNTVVDVVGRQGDVRQSLTMSQIINQNTFREAFGRSRQRSKTTLKQMIFTLDRLMYDNFVELTPDSQIAMMPARLIHYIENTLILIENETARLQTIVFTAKEQITITCLLITLVADQVLRQSSDSNRAYFIYDLFYKVSANIPGIQKYTRYIPIEQFCALKNEQDMLSLFNCRQTFDQFTTFTTVWFKLTENITLVPQLYRFMLNLWQMTLLKHHGVILREGTKTPLLTRSTVRHMLQDCFSLVHLMVRDTQDKRADHLINFQLTIEAIMELVQPQAKSQAQFESFADRGSKSIAYTTTALYQLAIACLMDRPFQEIGVNILRRILEDSEFYKVIENVENVPQTFFTLKLPQIQSSLLDALLKVAHLPKASENVFKCLINTIRAKDSLLTSDSSRLAKEEFHRFLLVLPYLISQFTSPQDVRTSVQVFSNKRTIVQLLKKSLPSISITNKARILQILDVIQREVDQDDQLLVHEQFNLLIEAVKEQLQTQDFGQSVLDQCFSSASMMLKGGVDSIRPEILREFLSLIAPGQTVALNGSVEWPQEVLGEPACSIAEDVRTVYFSTKHIILKEIEMAPEADELDCAVYFTGEEQTNQPSQVTSQQHKRMASNSDRASIGAISNEGAFTKNPVFRQKEPERVSKYQYNVFTANPTIPESEEQKHYSPDKQPVRKSAPHQQSPDILQVYRDQSPPQGYNQTTHNSLLGTFAKDDNQRELERDPMQISQAISSISGASMKDSMIQRQPIYGGGRSQAEQQRPTTGGFQEDFNFDVDQPHQFRQTQPQQLKPSPLQDKTRVVDLQNNWLTDPQPSQQLNVSRTTQKLSTLEKQLRLLSKDEDTLIEFENHLTAKRIDLDMLGFYVKCLEFKTETQNINIVAGLILDNYLSEDAENYVGDRISTAVINELIHDFQVAISQGVPVSSTLFDKCLAVFRPLMEREFTEFMSN